MFDDYDEFMNKRYEICFDMEVLWREIIYLFICDFFKKDFVSKIKKLFDDFIILFENMIFLFFKIYLEVCILRYCFGVLYGEVDYENCLIDDFDELIINEM